MALFSGFIALLDSNLGGEYWLKARLSLVGLCLSAQTTRGEVESCPPPAEMHAILCFLHLVFASLLKGCLKPARSTTCSHQHAEPMQGIAAIASTDVTRGPKPDLWL